jgi:hypothetical protein
MPLEDRVRRYGYTLGASEQRLPRFPELGIVVTRAFRYRTNRAIPNGISQLPVAFYSAGDRVIAAGKPHDKLRFLKTGGVGVLRNDNRIALIKTPGGALGEFSLPLDTETIAEVYSSRVSSESSRLFAPACFA